jgi:hypothetical protein
MTVLPHPSNSPIPVPSDFHPFGALKNTIHGKKFGSDGHRFLKKQGSGCKCRVQTGARRG